jgi:hypothetical protein
MVLPFAGRGYRRAMPNLTPGEARQTLVNPGVIRNPET